MRGPLELPSVLPELPSMLLELPLVAAPVGVLLRQQLVAARTQRLKDRALLAGDVLPVLGLAGGAPVHVAAPHRRWRGTRDFWVCLEDGSDRVVLHNPPAG